jgi:hypothetical protein
MFRAFNALCWEQLRPVALPLIVATAYFLLVPWLLMLLPEEYRTPKSIPLFAALPGALWLFSLVGMTQGADTGLDQTTSGFPSRLFLLPVSTTMLVLPTFVLTTMGSMLGMLLFMLGIGRVCGIAEVPLWWLLLPGVFVAWLQAGSWMPFPLPLLRLVPIMLSAPVIWIGSLFIVGAGITDTQITWLLVGLLLLGQVVAWRGVVLARRGVGVAPPQEYVEQNRGIVELAKPFASPLWAQLWLEWRLHRRTLLAGLGYTLVLICPLMEMVAQTAEARPWILEAISPTLAAWGPTWWAMLGLLMPMGYVLFGGVDFGRCDLGHRGHHLPLWFATVPLSNRQIIQAKWLVISLGAALLWGGNLLIGFGWATLTGRLPQMTHSLAQTTGSLGMGLLLLLLVIIAGWALSCLWLMGTMPCGLSGQIVWVVLGFVLGLAMFLAAGLALYASRNHPDLALLAVLLMQLIPAAILPWAERALRANRAR